MKDHKKYYGIYIRSSMLVSLAIVILGFLFVPTIEVEPFAGVVDPEDRFLPPDVFPPVDNPDPESPQRPKPIPPVEPADPGDTSAVNTIDSTVFWDKPIGNIPTGPDIEILPYHMVEIKPELISIPIPQYPEIVRQAGIEGNTVVKALVNIDGSIIEVKILKSSGNQMLDQAALAAAKRAKFTPAKQRDRFVRVYVKIPVKFRLTNG